MCLKNADLTGIGGKGGQAVSFTAVQILMMGCNRCLQIQRARTANPCQIFAPCPCARKFIASIFDPAPRRAVHSACMAKDISLKHPFRMTFGGTIKHRTWRQNLFGVIADCVCIQICVQCKIIALRLRDGIKPCAVDKFQHLLFSSQQRHNMILQVLPR